MSRGRIIIRIIAALLIAGPALRLGGLIVGHWRFPATLWLLDFLLPLALAALLLLRQNWTRLLVGWLSILAVMINILHALLRGNPFWVVVVRSIATFLIGALLLWSPSVRAYFGRDEAIQDSLV